MIDVKMLMQASITETARFETGGSLADVRVADDRASSSADGCLTAQIAAGESLQLTIEQDRRRSLRLRTARGADIDLVMVDRPSGVRSPTRTVQLEADEPRYLNLSARRVDVELSLSASGDQVLQLCESTPELASSISRNRVNLNRTQIVQPQAEQHNLWRPRQDSNLRRTV